jgi:hypothetical protein
MSRSKQTLATHFAQFPATRPRLAAVPLRRIASTDHPAARHPHVVEALSCHQWAE